MDENIKNIFSIGIPVLTLIVGVVVAFYKMKNEFKEELNKVEKEFSEKLVKQNQKTHQLEIDIVTLKGRDENQQQIINQFQSQVLDHLPKIYEIINNQTNNKKTKL
jgi:hypothetical protein